MWVKDKTSRFWWWNQIKLINVFCIESILKSSEMFIYSIQIYNKKEAILNSSMIFLISRNLLLD